MTSNSEIRRRAREILGTNLFSASWLYPVLIAVIVSVLNAIVSSTFVGPVVLSGLLSVASARYFLDRVRGNIEPREIESSIEGLKVNMLGSLLTGVLYNLFVAIGSIILFVPGIIFGFSFSMAFYIINDHPEMTAMEALRESRRLMNGHKMQYFLLSLSFIGWMLLGMACLGVGTLWASSYMSCASAVFYDELVANDKGFFTVNEEASEA
jgi:uncharacterized membrane protein